MLISTLIFNLNVLRREQKPRLKNNQEKTFTNWGQCRKKGGKKEKEILYNKKKRNQLRKTEIMSTKRK